MTASDPTADLVEAFFAYRRTGDEGLAWAWEELEDLIREDPVQAWPVVLRLVREAPDEPALYYVAAGPLEDFLTRHGAAHLHRVLGVASGDDRLRRALGGVWGGEGMDPGVWQAIQRVAIPEGPLGAHAFELVAPEGWAVDDRRGRARAVYHPAGVPPDEAEAVLFVDAGWRAPDARDIAAFIRADLSSRGAPGGEAGAADAGILDTGAGPAPLRRLALPDGRAALVAYVEAPRVVFELVLLARSEGALDQAAPALRELGRSFRVMERT